jgi:hypothetical protein
MTRIDHSSHKQRLLAVFCDWTCKFSH